jgi:hypothetical protein
MRLLDVVEKEKERKKERKEELISVTFASSHEQSVRFIHSFIHSPSPLFSPYPSFFFFFFFSWSSCWIDLQEQSYLLCSARPATRLRRPRTTVPWSCGRCRLAKSSAASPAQPTGPSGAARFPKTARCWPAALAMAKSTSGSHPPAVSSSPTKLTFTKKKKKNEEKKGRETSQGGKFERQFSRNL